MTDATATPRAPKNMKRIQKRMPKCLFLKRTCFELTSWNPIFSPIRFWSQNRTTIQLHQTYFQAILRAPGGRQNSQKSVNMGIKFGCFFGMPPGRRPGGFWKLN